MLARNNFVLGTIYLPVLYTFPKIDLRSAASDNVDFYFLDVYNLIEYKSIKTLLLVKRNRKE